MLCGAFHKIKPSDIFAIDFIPCSVVVMSLPLMFPTFSLDFSLKEDEINPGHYNPIPEVTDVFGMPPMVGLCLLGHVFNPPSL